jgi:hypothetical protein
MRQFDICRLRQNAEQLVVILQHDTVDELDTRIVAPLSDKPYRKMIGGIRLALEFDRTNFVLQLDRLAAIDRRAIGTVVGNLGADQYRIKNALDLLFLGV